MAFLRTGMAVLAAMVLLAACKPAQDHAADVAAAGAAGSRLTLGTVQRDIRVGMSGAEVATVLGAPNIVTTDERRRETWVYDRIATEQTYSTSSGGAGIPLIAGIGGSTGAGSRSQRTLTVIIQYDEARLVRDFSYRSSSF